MVDDTLMGSVAPLIHLQFQYRQLETILAIAYAGACFFSFWAFTMHYISPSRQVATLGFYLLMSLAALTRTIWFASPYSVFSVAMEPPRLLRGDVGWIDFMAYEATELLGSYLLYSIFILIVVFWADMLRRLFTQNNVQSNPLRRFFIILSLILCAQTLGFVIFLTKRSDSYWLMLYDDVLLSLLSFASLVSITVYSYRMKTVLQAFLEVSQIDTTDRIKAVNWATAICCLFLVCNMVFLGYSLISIAQFNEVSALFTSKSWWIVVASKHSIEILSLYFLLYSLWGKNSDESQRKEGYEPIPDILSDEENTIGMIRNQPN